MRRFALWLGVVCCPAFAASSSLTPTQVSAAIAKNGAQAFFASLSEQQADALLARIGSGKASWVALAPKLAPGADGANAEGLAIALAYALPKNASAVLKAADSVAEDKPVLAISRVCGIPFIDPPPPDYQEKAARALAAVKDPTLRPAKIHCIAALNKR